LLSQLHPRLYLPCRSANPRRAAFACFIRQHRGSRRPITNDICRSRQSPDGATLHELPSGRRPSAAGQRPPYPSAGGLARAQRQWHTRAALRRMPHRPQLYADDRRSELSKHPGAPALGLGADRNGMGRQVNRGHMPATQGSGPQWRPKPWPCCTTTSRPTIWWDGLGGPEAGGNRRAEPRSSSATSCRPGSIPAPNVPRPARSQVPHFSCRAAHEPDTSCWRGRRRRPPLGNQSKNFWNICREMATLAHLEGDAAGHLAAGASRKKCWLSWQCLPVKGTNAPTPPLRRDYAAPAGSSRTTIIGFLARAICCGRSWPWATDMLRRAKSSTLWRCFRRTGRVARTLDTKGIRNCTRENETYSCSRR
jgi:hypothetical protein